jgi:hypothetical protein
MSGHDDQERPGADRAVTLSARQATALRALLTATTEPGYVATGRLEDAVAGAARYAGDARPPLTPAEYHEAVDALFPRRGRRRARPGNPCVDHDPHWWVAEHPGAPRHAAAWSGLALTGRRRQVPYAGITTDGGTQ